VSAAALGLALGAAVVHALWNVLLAREEDVEAATPVALAAGIVVLTPFALARWHVGADAWPYVAASVAFELAYFWLLARAYATGEVGFVYPVARGVAPVLVLIAGAAALGAVPTAAGAAGVISICIGVLLVRPPRRDAPDTVEASGAGGGGWRVWCLPLAVAAAIAGYTLVDDRGVEHAGALTYLWLVLAPVAVVQLVAVRARARAALTGGAVAVGVSMVAAYGLTLAALDLAAAGPVAAVRESSVVVAVGIAALLLGEGLTGRRLGGAVLVAAGVAAIGLG
jgi:drug/metabolite transporter (DMT)-like permease